MARGLCILFLPFENEVKDIHNKDPRKLLAANTEVINSNRKMFEKNNLINELISQLESEREDGEESDDEGDDDENEEETTDKCDLLKEQEEHDKQKAKDALPKEDTTLDYLEPEELRRQITSLNPQ